MDEQTGSREAQRSRQKVRLMYTEREETRNKKAPLCWCTCQVLYNAMTHRDHPVGQVTSARNLHGPQDGQTHMTPAQTVANHCGHG